MKITYDGVLTFLALLAIIWCSVLLIMDRSYPDDSRSSSAEALL